MRVISEERKILRLLIAVLTGILLLEGAFNLFLAPRLKISTVVLESELAIDDRALLNLTGLDRDNWFFNVNRENVEDSLNSLAVVDEAVVMKQFPNKLSISIASRKPLVMALKSNEGELIPLVIDREGVVFLAGRAVYSYDLPVIGGFDTARDGAGTRIPGELVPLLEDLDRLKNTSRDLYDIISEINVMPEERGVVDIELYLTTHTIPVLLDLPVTEEKMNQALMVVDVMEREGLAGRIEEVDLRSGSVVYREREAEGV